jgi:tRNA(Ile2) C34 agmatinyltransferase TiaS
MLFVGLDDTDNLESRGTGYLARQIAGAMARNGEVIGVTRHQLLVDPRVPYTKKNSASAILVRGDGLDVETVMERVRALMLADFHPGSDPGLCVAESVPAAIIDFGRRAQREVVTQQEARELAAQCGIPLVGLGGDEGGVIGALSAVGLAACGDDGRYVLVGHSRDLTGLQPVSAILEIGIDAVQTLDGRPVSDGLVSIDRLRPARRGERAVLFVERDGDHWLPLKLD